MLTAVTPAHGEQAMKDIVYQLLMWSQLIRNKYGLTVLIDLKGGLLWS